MVVNGRSDEAFMHLDFTHGTTSPNNGDSITRRARIFRYQRRFFDLGLSNDYPVERNFVELGEKAKRRDMRDLDRQHRYASFDDELLKPRQWIAPAERPVCAFSKSAPRDWQRWRWLPPSIARRNERFREGHAEG